MAAIAADHLRLMVIGPSTLQSGVAAQFDITTTEVTGAPVSIPVEVDFIPPTASPFGPQGIYRPARALAGCYSGRHVFARQVPH